MLRKLALKKLKSSDLSFFKSYLAKHPQTKQKGLNLDLRIMEGKFFPSLRALLEPLHKRAVHVDLTMFGPGTAEAHSMARKVKRDAKNIRLNGEAVDAPLDDQGRYDVLAPGDFAMIEFVGEPLPSAVNIVLIAAAHPDDASLHTALSLILPSATDSMKSISEDGLADIISSVSPLPDHPIRNWMDAAILENIGQGDAGAMESLNKCRPGRGMTPSDLKASKASAERTGALGEELLDQFFHSQGLADVSEHEWTAQINAISPFDFLLKTDDGDERHADAKSTSGKFENPVFMSIAEIRHAVQSDIPYDIYRLYGVTEASASLRIAKNVGPQLATVLEALKGIPAGVGVDSLSFAPPFFQFLPHVYQIEVADSGDDEAA